MASDAQPPVCGSPRDHLANERTFLAWLRTAISLISFGITINRFSRYLLDLELKGGESPAVHRQISAERLGLGMFLFGLLTMILALIRWRRLDQLILRGEFRPDNRIIWITAASVTVLSLAAMVWILRY